MEFRKDFRRFLMTKPGPKKRPKSLRRSERIEVVMTQDERKMLEKAAKAHGLPLAVFIRSSALVTAETVQTSNKRSAD
jgi:uncharacterized protein (DUF1778 family)